MILEQIPLCHFTGNTTTIFPFPVFKNLVNGAGKLLFCNNLTKVITNLKSGASKNFDPRIEPDLTPIRIRHL